MQLFFAPVPCASHLLPAGGRLTTVHKSRGGNGCFQIVGSRHLKLDGFNDIAHRDLPTMLERNLSPEDVGFAQLGEGESFRLPDGGFKFFSRESRAESRVVLAAQVEELNREFIRGQKQRQTKIARTNAEFEMVADDPRIYVAIKEPTDAMFPRTPFVLTNSGGEVAHRVKLEMPWKLKGRNVSFEMVETIPAGENRETLRRLVKKV